MLTMPAILGPIGFLLAAMPILIPVMVGFRRVTGRYPSTNELIVCSVLLCLLILRLCTWIWPHV